jgi:hypothetical protein
MNYGTGFEHHERLRSNKWLVSLMMAVDRRNM